MTTDKNKQKKSRTIAYLRVSTAYQDLKSQRHEITNYVKANKLEVDLYLEVEMSSRKSMVLRKMKELEDELVVGDVLIAVELSRLGRNLAEVVQFVDNLLRKKVRIILINNGIDTARRSDPYAQANLNMQIGMFSVMARLERDLISIRTREGLLAARSEGRIGGRRTGSLHKSIYDRHLPEISKYLTADISLPSIIRLIGEGKTRSLSVYLAKRGFLKKQLYNPH